MSRGMKWLLVLAALMIAVAFAAVPRASDELYPLEDSEPYVAPDDHESDKIAAMQFSADPAGPWTNIDLSQPLFIPARTTAHFRAVPLSPDVELSWGGAASGTGETASVKFGEPSRDRADGRTISVFAGDEKELPAAEARIIVYEIRPSGPYIVAVGAEAQFNAEVYPDFVRGRGEWALPGARLAMTGRSDWLHRHTATLRGSRPSGYLNDTSFTFHYSPESQGIDSETEFFMTMMGVFEIQYRFDVSDPWSKLPDGGAPIVVHPETTIYFLAVNQPDIQCGPLKWYLGDNDLGYDDLLSISHAFNNMGSFTIKAKAGDSEAAASIAAVELTDVNVQNASHLWLNKFIAKPENQPGGYVILTAQLTPSVSASHVPEGFVTWTGGEEGANRLERKVELHVTGLTEVNAACGSINIDSEIWIVGVGAIKYKNSSGSYVSPPAENFAVVKGTTLELKAIPDPINAPAWPDTYPRWGGAAYGNNPGEHAQVTFSVASSYPGDPKTVSAICGNTVTLPVIVVDIEAFDIEARRISANYQELVEEYHIIKYDELYETFSTFSFRINLEDWPTPINLRIELLEEDGYGLINKVLISDSVSSFNYTFDEEFHLVRIRFYGDLNGDMKWNYGEPRIHSRFKTLNLILHVLDVQYSSEIEFKNEHGQTVTCPQEIRNIIGKEFRKAEIDARRNDSERSPIEVVDYRATVRYLLGDCEVFTANENRPDPVEDDPDEREKHYEADCHIVIVRSLVNYSGICRGNNLNEIIVQWNGHYTHKVIGHEIGHGLGWIGHQDDPPYIYIMYSGVLSTLDDGTHLTKDESYIFSGLSIYP